MHTLAMRCVNTIGCVTLVYCVGFRPNIHGVCILIHHENENTMNCLFKLKLDFLK